MKQTLIKVAKANFTLFIVTSKILAFSVLWTVPTFPHELWLEPKKFHLNTNEILEVNIKLGEKMQGANLAFIPKNFEEFFWSQNGVKNIVKSSLGDRPALYERVIEDGLASVVYVSKPSTLMYNTLGKFEKFANHKNLGPVKQWHLEYCFPEKKFFETYRRFAKLIVGIGSSPGNDNYFGMTTELILLNNPFEDKAQDFLKLKLIYNGRPRKSAQVEIFERSETGIVRITTTKTSDDGIVTVPIKRGAAYLFDAVKLRRVEPSTNQKAVWETLWASLMVKVPKQP